MELHSEDKDKRISKICYYYFYFLKINIIFFLRKERRTKYFPNRSRKNYLEEKP
ncbi:hypothetical protein RLOC_00001358 [Lonchura striata]|uniref:Uncharacterized protein n=1 Tax=Lonchura striata TaxID=40157 RepID=A0A218V7J2_9PASE|nr:hypothetical protein RLOC_00001358 [Lonchura striata domestica]